MISICRASYRDLLGTARTIVDADMQMHDTEKLLVDLGRRSDSRIVDKIAMNQAQLARERSAERMCSAGCIATAILNDLPQKHPTSHSLRSSPSCSNVSLRCTVC